MCDIQFTIEGILNRSIVDNCSADPDVCRRSGSSAVSEWIEVDQDPKLFECPKDGRESRAAVTLYHQVHELFECCYGPSG